MRTNTLGPLRKLAEGGIMCRKNLLINFQEAFMQFLNRLGLIFLGSVADAMYLKRKILPQAPGLGNSGGMTRTNPYFVSFTRAIIRKF